MTKVLITGATGNVGMEVIKSLQRLDHSLDVYAGVRDVEADRHKFDNYSIIVTPFDFKDVGSYDAALTGCDILFLLRPPQIADVEKYFKPIVETCKDKGVKHIVFLSVQGVENSRIIPHHKIEKLIVDSQINYTFLRPAYFMQNFTTTLRHDLVSKRRIYLPAGNAKFTLVDVSDLGAVAATILTNIANHINTSYELTCHTSMTFREMAMTLGDKLGVDIQFKSPNLVSFFISKKREGMPVMFILVMIMLHYFPRFQKEPRTTDCVEKITNQSPTTFEQFIDRNRKLLMG